MKNIVKKIALILVVLLVCSIASFAQVAKKTSGPTTAIALTDNGYPLVRLPMVGMNLDVGATISSPAAGTTNFTLIIRGELPIAKIGSVNTYWAPEAALTSTAGTSSITLNLKAGGEYLFANNLSVFGDATLLTLTSAPGTTTWTVGANGAQMYSGIRLYM